MSETAAPPPAAKPPLPPGTQVMPLSEALEKLARLEQDGKLAEADDLARRMLAAMPEHPHILHLAGIVSYRLGRLDEAIERMETAQEIAPNVALYPRNMCEVYRGAGRLEEAVKAGRRAVELAPQDSRALFNLALIHYERLELEESVQAAEAAIALDPDYPEAHFEKAEALLLAGRLKEGWESYEWRFKLKQAEGMLPKTDKPQWDGTPLPPGRLLVIGDQGFGDCIQFGRLIPWVASVCPRPVLACSGDLVPILRQLPGIGKIVTRWEDTGEFDAYIPLSGLPRLYGLTTENIPPAGYLAPPEALVRAWGEKLDRLTPRGKKRIGLVWAGRPTHKNDKKRTLKLAQFAPLFARDDVVVLTVQKGDQIAQVGGYYGRAPLVNLGPEISDFIDTMAILKNIDRLVTIDTSVAHVAGAIGAPASLVLPKAPDWRWLLGREDSPWYPSLKLYRQTTAYEWAGVIERVVAEL
ncbi:tetratricopeptide repeat-containing glycosyltransferase family protein [Acidocella sp.]|uniref:tetratricopeptide repeat-containing glycosyltransferase family protein n=1 Tax=Acidocella sp. TaxID=50710 RepID=UPI00260EDC55|nr:tetratricopeptide repeat-containing glycosyltransferase family protein [Acidocella sp.]